MDDLSTTEILQKSKIKKLKINYTKTCTCKDNHINCLTPKEWVKGQVAVWDFYYTKEDLRDKNIHPAMYPIALPSKCIELFTHKGELVLDPFVGTGTTLLAAKNLARNAVGFDLKKEYIEVAKKRLKQASLNHETQQIPICDDAKNISQYLEPESVKLCVTSPPYANMLNKPRLNKSMRADLRENEHFMKVQQYSNDKRDLGTMEVPQFSNAIEDIYKGIFPLMKPRGHCVINLNDLWLENRRIPTHIFVIQAMEKAGFELRNIIIWDKHNLVNGVGIFGWPSNYITLGTTFEYILDFWKPSSN